jgi:hypothetical protein
LERFTPKEESTSKKGKVSPKEEEVSKSNKGSAKHGESSKSAKHSPKEKESSSKKEKSVPMEEGEVEEDSKKRKRDESEEEVEQSASEEDNEGSKGKAKAKPKGRARGGGRRKAAAKGGKKAPKRKAVPASPTKPGEVDTAGRKRRKAVWKTEIVANEANRAIVEEMNDLSKRYYKEGDTGRGGNPILYYQFQWFHFIDLFVCLSRFILFSQQANTPTLPWCSVTLIIRSGRTRTPVRSPVLGLILTKMCMKSRKKENPIAWKNLKREQNHKKQFTHKRNIRRMLCNHQFRPFKTPSFLLNS